MVTPPGSSTASTLLSVLSYSLCAAGVSGLACGAEPNGPADSPLGRYFLVASEGLYVVEKDGRPSWSYHPTPYQGQGWGKYDDLIYDGWVLPGERVLFSTHRYVRELDRNKQTVWEYRVPGMTEIKSCVPLGNGRVAVLHSNQQAILEIEEGTGSITHRIPLSAKGSDHTRYNMIRRTPSGNYLVALRAEERFVEVDRDGEILRSFPVSGLPVMAQRMSDGTTLCSGEFGLLRFDADGTEIWSLTREDVAPSFPLIYAVGFNEMKDGRLLVVNSDWHYARKNQNRVQMFLVDSNRNFPWTLPSSAFDGWKKSAVEKKTGFTEHRCALIQIFPDK